MPGIVCRLKDNTCAKEQQQQKSALSRCVSCSAAIDEGKRETCIISSGSYFFFF